MSAIQTTTPPTGRELRLLSKLRSLESALVSRANLSAAAGVTFGGDRDLYNVLGYKKVLTPLDYFDRFERDGIARRVVKAFPDATWRGVGGELVEDNDPSIVTTFESEWFLLSDRLKCWSVFRRADILAGLGRFAVVLIGAPGDLHLELPAKLKSQEILFLSPYPERDVEIQEFETDIQNARYGQPKMYKISLADSNANTVKGKSVASKDVHFSRVIHIAEGLENTLYHVPRLKPVWNRFDDLDKITGGGSEAFWIRANPGRQFNVDKDMTFAEGEEEKFSDEIEKYMMGISRHFQTRGVEVNDFSVDPANFDKNVDATLGQIAAGAEIPQRILLGSERGQLASEQDRANWDERVQDRCMEYAGPVVVRPFVDNVLIARGALPTPKEYNIRWPLHEQSNAERAAFAAQLSLVNRNQGRIVFTENEIRDLAFGMDPLDPAVEEENRKKSESKRVVTTDGEESVDVPVVSSSHRKRQVLSAKYQVWRKNGKRPTV